MITLVRIMLQMKSKFAMNDETSAGTKVSADVRKNPMKIELLDEVVVALEAVRARRPLVMCLTNSVAANFTANCLLALGATPAMINEPAEAEELAVTAAAVLINVGTVTQLQAEAMRRAINACRRHNVPWVLDPVAVDKLSFRRELVKEFIEQQPTLIRGNAREVASLTIPPGITTLATGAVDEVNGEVRIANGVEILTRVTATGCAQGALAAAFCAVTTPCVAALAAAVVMGLAGEFAVQKTSQLGTFQMAIIDALGAMTQQAILQNAKILPPSN